MRTGFLQRSKLAAVLVALLCILVATVGLHYSQPADFEASTGTVGKAVDFCGGELTVTRVRVGVEVTRDGESQATTAGLFVVVTVVLAAPEDKVTASSSKLISGDYEYEDFGTSGQISADPGFQSTGDIIFEVNPAHIDGLTAEIWQGEIIAGYQEHAVIRLGITSRNAEQWRQAGAGQAVEIQMYPSSEAIP